MKMGFSYQEAMDMPEADAMAFCETFASLTPQKGKPTSGKRTSPDHYSTGQTYQVKRR